MRSELPSELFLPDAPPVGTWDDLAAADPLAAGMRIVSTEAGEILVFDVGSEEGPRFGGVVRPASVGVRSRSCRPDRSLGGQQVADSVTPRAGVARGRRASSVPSRGSRR